MEPEFSTKQLERKLLSTNYTACIICQKTDSDAGPLQKLTNHGYPSLLYAVTNRKDDVSYRLDNQLKAQCDFLGRNPLWHTQCRAKYTNRKTVDQKRKKVEKPEGTSFEAELNPEPDNSRPNKKKHGCQCHSPSNTRKSASFVEEHTRPGGIDHSF